MLGLAAGRQPETLLGALVSLLLRHDQSCPEKVRPVSPSRRPTGAGVQFCKSRILEKQAENAKGEWQRISNSPALGTQTPPTQGGVQPVAARDKPSRTANLRPPCRSKTIDHAHRSGSQPRPAPTTPLAVPSGRLGGEGLDQLHSLLQLLTLLSVQDRLTIAHLVKSVGKFCQGLFPFRLVGGISRYNPF